MGVNGGPTILQRVRDACTRVGWSRSLSRNAKGAVLFASTSEVLNLDYRPNLTVRDVCIEAALIVKISPVALDFFTLVSEDGKHYLNPLKVLFEEDCNCRFQFRLCIKACIGSEIRDCDKEAFEYYFHQCRQDFLKGTVGECTDDHLKEFAELVILEILYQTKQSHGPLTPKDIIDNPKQYGIRKLFKRGVFASYPVKEIKAFLKEKIPQFEKLTVDQIKPLFISILERTEDFFVHKFFLEKAYFSKTVKKFEVLISAEFGIKKRRIDLDSANIYPEEIVKEFSEVQGLDLDPHSNKITILRVNRGKEVLMSNSPEEIYSFTTLIEGYYRLMVNQYKDLRKSKGGQNILCHGPIERRKAEFLLQQGSKDDGFCLLRRKRDKHFSFALSICVGENVMHYEIERNKNGEFYLESDRSKVFSGWRELVEHYRHSKDGLPVVLKDLCLPKPEGFAALLDRQLMVPVAPHVDMVDAVFRISCSDLSISKTNLSVQKGEFGVIRKGTWVCPTADEPVEVISRALLKPVIGKNILELREVIQTLSQLQNPYLIQFHGVAEIEKALIFVFDFGAEGPLDLYIKENSGKEHGITKGRVVSYAAQIAEGMMFLHSKNCVHGRLRAHNVFVANEECVKIGDSGLLHMLQKGFRFHQSKRGYGFSYCWFSPLALQNHTFTFASDIWAFGMTLWEIFSMKAPFHSTFPGTVLSEKEIINRYLQGRYLNPDRPNCPSKVAELIRRCWAPVPEKRMSFVELVAELRSPELVPDTDVNEELVPPALSVREDWEEEMLPQTKDLELHSLDHPSDSQVSGVEYSCLPGIEPQGSLGNSETSIHYPEAARFSSSPVFFGKNGVRKRTISKTLSHPGLGSETSQACLARKPKSLLALRKPSITRVSSCPPAIQVEGEVDRQDRVRYVSMTSRPKSPVPQNLKTSNAELFAPFMSNVSVEMGALSTAVDSSASGIAYSGDFSEWQDNNNDPDIVEEGEGAVDSDNDDGFDADAELKAMQFLNMHFTGHAQSGFGNIPLENVKPDEDAKPEANKTDSGVMGNQSFHPAEVCSDQMSETGSQGYVEINTNDKSSSAFTRVVESEDSKNQDFNSQPAGLHVAGSYVKLFPANQFDMPNFQPKRGDIAKDPLPELGTYWHHGLSVQKETDNARSKPTENSNENLHSQATELRGGPDYARTASLCKIDKERVAEPRNDEILDTLNESPDTFLASLLGHRQQENESDVPAGSLFDAREGGPEEPIGEDLSDYSEADDEEPNSSNNAELSLGLFVSAATQLAATSSGQGISSQCIPLLPVADFVFNPNRSVDQPPSVKDSHSFVKDQSNKCNQLDSTDFSDGLISSAKVNKDCAYRICDENLAACSTIDTQDPSSGGGDTSYARTTIGSDSLFRRPLGLFLTDTSPPGSIDYQHENLELETISLNNLSKESSAEGLDFCEEHFSSQDSQSSYTNQLDETCDEGDILSFDREHTTKINDGGSSIDLSLAGYQPVASSTRHWNESTATPVGCVGLKDQTQRTTDDSYVANVSVPPAVHETLYHQPPTLAEGDLSRASSSHSLSSSSEDIWSDLVSTPLQPSPRMNQPDDPSDLGQRPWRKASANASSSTGRKESISKRTFDMSKIPPHLQVPYEHIRLCESLGEGHFGKVNKAEIRCSDRGKLQREAVAVKVLKKNTSEKDFDDFKKEVENMIYITSKQNCDYIIRLRGVCIDKDQSLMLITELAPYGPLKLYLPANKDILGIPQLLEYSVQICKGMMYMEKQQLLHRDLATRNILVMREDLVKISDFGLSRLQDYYKTYGEGVFPLKWYALESITRGRFTSKSDVWSFGITMWEMLTYGETPYKDIDSKQLYRFLEDGKRLPCPASCPENIYSLMFDCWSADPMKRPSFFLLSKQFAKLQGIYS